MLWWGSPYILWDPMGAPPPLNPLVGVPLNLMGLYGGGPSKFYGALWCPPPPNPFGGGPSNFSGALWWPPPQNPLVGVPLNPMGLYDGTTPPKSYGALWVDPPLNPMGPYGWTPP